MLLPVRISYKTCFYAPMPKFCERTNEGTTRRGKGMKINYIQTRMYWPTGVLKTPVIITMEREPRCIFGAEDRDSFSISSIRHARTVLSLAATNNDNHRDK